MYDRMGSTPETAPLRGWSEVETNLSFLKRPPKEKITYTGLRLFKGDYTHIKKQAADFKSRPRDDENRATFERSAAYAAELIVEAYKVHWEKNDDPDMVGEPKNFASNLEALSLITARLTMMVLAAEHLPFDEKRFQQQARDGAKAILEHDADTFLGQRLKYSMDAYRRGMSMSSSTRPHGLASRAQRLSGGEAGHGDVVMDEEDRNGDESAILSDEEEWYTDNGNGKMERMTTNADMDLLPEEPEDEEDAGPDKKRPKSETDGFAFATT